MLTGTGTSITHGGEGAGRADGGRPAETARGESYVLPQWAIQIVRVVLRALFRLFFGLRLEGAENIPREGGLIVASNHQTYIDPFWIAAPFNRQMRFLTWDAVFGWPVLGALARWLGAWPLGRGAASATRRSVQWLRGGGVLVIFPEGVRTFADGRLRDLKPGAVRLALRAGVPILPVTIRGGNRVWPRGRKWPRLGRVEVVYHPPLRMTVLPGEDTRERTSRETERLAEIINSAL